MVTVVAAPIDVAFPGGVPAVRLALGPCRLSLARGTGASWLSGSYTDATGVMPLHVATEGENVVVRQRFDPGALLRAVPELPRLVLTISAEHALTLDVDAGAAECELDLGGIPVTRFVLRAGAGRYAVLFSAPNPEVMRLLDVSAGAGSLTLRRLANANAEEMKIGGGLAGCLIDFGGTLRRDASVRVGSGLAAIELSLPESTAARIEPRSFAASQSVSGALVEKEGWLCTPAALAGESPALAIRAEVAFGGLVIRTYPGADADHGERPSDG